jgi:hypothetical protein
MFVISLGDGPGGQQHHAPSHLRGFSSGPPETSDLPASCHHFFSPPSEEVVTRKPVRGGWAGGGDAQGADTAKTVLGPWTRTGLLREGETTMPAVYFRIEKVKYSTFEIKISSVKLIMIIHFESNMGVLSPSS